MGLALLFSLLLSAPASASAPEWSAAELKSLFLRAEAAARATNMQAKDEELVNITGLAYRLERQAQEPVEAYAERVLKKREPSHPPVAPGQNLIAVMRRFYADAGERAQRLARFERDHRDRNFLEQKGQEALAGARQLATMLVTKIEGVEGFMQPLPEAEGEAATQHGAKALVGPDGTVNLENLDRVVFAGDLPPADTPRTPHGAIRELYAAQKQYNISAQMLGQVDPMLKKGAGTVRAFIPRFAKASFLNELVIAAREAGMHTFILMITAPGNAGLRQLPIALTKPKGKKAPILVEFRCKSTVTMQACAEWAAENHKKGPLFYAE